ncbi:MAG: hypothetical protein GF307_01730 [candidate division Zixibacteria bacterium]|nr:hypothetical protein [candidate division Zixibacteria bacterium]
MQTKILLSIILLAGILLPSVSYAEESSSQTILEYLGGNATHEELADSAHPYYKFQHRVRFLQPPHPPIEMQRKGFRPQRRWIRYYRYFDCAQPRINRKINDIYHDDSCYGDIYSINGNKVWGAPGFTGPDTMLLNKGPNSLLYGAIDYIIRFKIAIDSVNGFSGAPLDTLGYISIGYNSTVFHEKKRIWLVDDGSYFIEPFSFVWIGDSNFSFYRMTKGEFEYRVYSFGKREMYIDSVFAASYTGIASIEYQMYDDVIEARLLHWANVDTVYGIYSDEPVHPDSLTGLLHLANLYESALARGGITLLPIQNRKIFPSENYTPLWPELPETSNRGVLRAIVLPEK